MTTSFDKEVFAARARECGAPLTDADIDNLFEGYGLLQRLVAQLDPPTDIAMEPALVFKPLSTP